MRTSEPDFENGTLNAYAIQGNEIKSNDLYGMKVIAKVGYTGKDWAAYAGPTEWSDQHVAKSGNKIAKEAAVALFPTLAATLRWRL